MNIVQIHNKIIARLDQVNTPRFTPFQRDNAINTSIDNLIRYKIDGVIENGKRVSFQKTKKIRDELYTIVKTDDTGLPFTFADDVVSGLPLDYRYLLLLKITINATAAMSDYCIPITYDDVPLLEKNPYMRPSKAYPCHFYYVEGANGLRCFYGNEGSDAITYAKIDYIAQPAIVNYGTVISPTTAVFATKKWVIATTVVQYPVGQYKAIGDKFELEIGDMILSGNAVVDFTETNMPVALQEEIISEAAKILNTDIENFDKWKVMEESDQIRKK